MDNSDCELPHYFAYDDACHLRRYLDLRNFESRTERSKKLSNKVHIIDRFHIHNHKDEWCQATCNPNLYSEIPGLNTVVCEEGWVGLSILLNI